MSDDANDDSRTKRVRNVKRSAKNDLLKSLGEAKRSGTVYRQDYEVQDVYNIVTEDEYAKLKNEKLKENFIEGDDDEYIDDGEEIFYQNEAKIKEDLTDKSKKKRGLSSPINSNISRKKSKLADDIKQPKLFSGPLSNYNIKSKPKSENIISTVLDDDFMKSMLSEIDQEGKKKNEKQSKLAPNKFKVEIKKTTFNIDKSSLQTPSPSTTTIKLNKKIKTSKVQVQLEEILNNIPDTEMTEIDNVEDKEEHKEEEIFDDIIDDIDFDEELEAESSEKKVKNTKGFVLQDKPKSTGSLLESVSSKMLFSQENINETDNMNDDLLDESNITNESDSKCFYWIDAYNDNKIAGCVFMFGKLLNDVKSKNTDTQFSNCCLKITDLERRLYFLPNPEYEYNDVYNEIKAVLNKHGITKFRCKPENKNYAFQLPHIPDNADYLMVQYDAKLPSIPQNTKGNTFTHVFGINTSCLELLILDLKLKGPSWLSLKGTTESNQKFSTCSKNFTIKGIKPISKCESISYIPPMKIMSLSVKMLTNPDKPDQNEIVSIGYVIHKQLFIDKPPPKNIFQEHITLIAPPRDCSLPYDFQKKLKLGQIGGSHYSPSTVFTEDTEHALLNSFLARLQVFDPDIILGHNILHGHILTQLMHRCSSLNISRWWRLGRLIRSRDDSNVSFNQLQWLERSITCGRLIIDTAISARELVKLRIYDLSNLIKEILPSNSSLQEQIEQIDEVKIKPYLFTDCNNLTILLNTTMAPAIANIHLIHVLQILPLALQITKICGNLLSRTLSCGKSERNEYLLLHAFTEANYVTPDKEQYNNTKSNRKDDDFDIDFDNDDSGTRKKPSYLGGLVLEPKKGLYESFILLMDFNSLYPSIIQEFNICFTTINRTVNNKEKDDDKTTETTIERGDDDELFMNDDLNELIRKVNLNSNQDIGILPREIKNLVDARRLVKKQLNNSQLDPIKRQQLDIRQKALKITANSMYGCLGFTSSRFKAKQLAALITGYGRNILGRTKELVESGSIRLPSNNANNQPIRLNLDIVYGDTDSIMVNTGLSRDTDFQMVLDIGQRIKSEVNKKHSNIELDIDGVFKKLLLLKKKKYAALTVIGNDPSRTKQELKGLDIVRRDWCRLAVDIGHEVLTIILESNLEYDQLVECIRRRLNNLAAAVRAGSIILDKFIITKSLTRNPEAYQNASGQPHVQVALRLNKSSESGRKLRAKDTVEYVICTEPGQNNKSAMDRAYSVQEVQNSQKQEECLSIDIEYYLRHQIHPVISRLVCCIVGLEPSVIAEELGIATGHLSPSKIGQPIIEDTQDQDEIIDVNVEPFQVTCRHCKNTNSLILNQPIKNHYSITASSADQWKCSECQKMAITNLIDVGYLKKCLVLKLDEFIEKYYKGLLECDSCNFICKKMQIMSTCDYDSKKQREGAYKCPLCAEGWLVKQYTSEELYCQIKHYLALFDSKDISKKYKDAVEVLEKCVEWYMKENDYSRIDCCKMPFAHLLDNEL